MRSRRFFISLFIACVIILCAMPEAAGVGAKKRCKVHGEILKKDKVPIAYGYIRDYYPAARKEILS